MNTTLWQENHDDGSLAQVPLGAALCLGRDGAPVGEVIVDAVTVAAVAPQGLVVAVALIPESLDRVVRHNRIPAASGLLPLRHADRIDVANQTFWIAVGGEPELTQYSPNQHTADVYCFLTKARLRDGEPIAVCPGTPLQSCDTIYKLSAWQAMLTQPDFRCACCGFDPNEPAWRPPPQHPTRRIDAVFDLIRQGEGK